MSITLHTGNPRNGKTYGMTKVALKCLNEGLIVYSNYKINWYGSKRRVWVWSEFRFKYIDNDASNLRYWKRLSDLYEVENGIVIMDEAHVYLNSRKWMDLPEDFERKLYQHGKDGLHIIGTVQNIRRLDTVMRELIDYWYFYKVFPNVPREPWKAHKPLIFFQWQILMETDMAPRRLKKMPRIFFFKKSIANSFDTLAKITLDK